jgi:hypothetical protein
VLSNGSVEKTRWDESWGRGAFGKGFNPRTGGKTLRFSRVVRI